MLPILAGLAGAACCIGVWNAVDRADGPNVAMWGAAALVLFGLTFFGAETHKPGGCFIDWDGRSNSEVCD
jgi:hypothetical protein